MRRLCVSTIAIGCLLASGIALPAGAGSLSAKHSDEFKSPYMRIYGPAEAPFGYVQFCLREPSECVPGQLEDQRLAASPERLSELDTVNRYVNHTIEPATDLELYGQVEYWTIPTTKGDCEDYALLKRHILIARGWPVSAVLMTVVRDEKGEGHAVLTARTSAGDFILDNKTDEVRIWHKTNYEYLMRQSYLNPNNWMSLDGKGMFAQVPLAGVRPRR
jgi:predicted transglutaminase-like cysteine proteinase